MRYLKYIISLVLILPLFAYASHRGSYYYGSETVTDSGEWQTAWTWTPNGEAVDSATRNYRNIIDASESSYSGTKVRLTATASSTQDGTIDATTIGVMSSGDVFDAAPTVITWDTGNGGCTVTAGNSKVSDEVNFTFTKTNRYGVHIYTTARNFKYIDSQPNPSSYYDSTASDESETLDPNTNNLAMHYVITKVEVYVP